MSRTLVRQLLNIRNSDTYDDTLAAGVALESGATRLEDDLNSIRSQLNRIIGQTNWYDALNNRNLTQVDTDLQALEELCIICNADVLADITVGGADNFVVLSVAGSEAPSQVAALLATTEGATVAASAFSAGAFAAHELVEVTGGSAVSPINLVDVRNSTTGQRIQSAGRDVFGLLQFESTGTDGVAFDDVSAGNRVKISFVRYNATFDDLEAVPNADIQGQTINYNYNFQRQLQNIDKNCFNAQRGFIDQSASVDVTLDNAIDNQSGVATAGQDIDVQLLAGFDWCFQDAAGADLFCVREDSAGSGSTVEVGSDADVYNNNAADVNFNEGATFDIAGTPISVGDTNAGCIETTGATDDLKVRGGQELFFDDTNQTGSAWVQTNGVKLTETTAEWDDYRTKFGEVSLFNAICQANSTVNRTKGCALVTAQIPANTDIGGTGGGTNLDQQLPDLSTGAFIADYDFYVNGIQVEQGADLNADCDVYPGTSLALGQLRHEEQLEIGDKICVICWA